MVGQMDTRHGVELRIWCRLQAPEALKMLRKLGVDYVNFIRECWMHVSVRRVNIFLRSNSQRTSYIASY